MSALLNALIRAFLEALNTVLLEIHDKVSDRKDSDQYS